MQKGPKGPSRPPAGEEAFEAVYIAPPSGLHRNPMQNKSKRSPPLCKYEPWDLLPYANGSAECQLRVSWGTLGILALCKTGAKKSQGWLTSPWDLLRGADYPLSPHLHRPPMQTGRPHGSQKPCLHRGLLCID